MKSLLNSSLVGALVWILNVQALAAYQDLVVTELMSEAIGTFGTNDILAGPDFWELTHFGTNTLTLSGYSFSDADQDPREFDAFIGLRVNPGESVIFVRQEPGPIQTPEDFYNWWWGPEDWPEPLPQVRFYSTTPGVPGIGFNGDVGDGIRIWDAGGRLVQSLDFGPAIEGHTFVPDPVTGIFGAFSQAGEDGAFVAAQSDDVGSPGTSPEPIPLFCLETVPTVMVCAGSSVTLRVLAGGLPRPEYQWFLNGSALSNLSGSTYSITNVRPEHAGTYTVEAFTARERIPCGSGQLTISTEPFAPVLVEPPADFECFPGQSAPFSIVVRSCPAPLYQWLTNGVPIPGATQSTLWLHNTPRDLSCTRVTVVVRHPLANLTNSAVLSVIERPLLKVTEVMAWPNQYLPARHQDWVELTNLGDQPANLRGYRLWDINSEIAFRNPFTNTQCVHIRPGESVILVESMSPSEFRRWWGADRLRPDLQVIPFEGFGFSKDGDTFHLWNPGAKDVDDTVAKAGFTFMYAWERGLSWECTLDCGLDFDFCLCLSELGKNGAFQAAEGGDIGSPGFFSGTTPSLLEQLPSCFPAQPAPFALRVRGSEAAPDLGTMECEVTVGICYQLQYADSLSSEAPDPWHPWSSFLATDPMMKIDIPRLDREGQRFFRLRQIGQ